MKKWVLDRWFEFLYLDWGSKIILTLGAICFIYLATVFLSGCAAPSLQMLSRLEVKMEDKIRYCSTMAANYDMLWYACNDKENAFHEEACANLERFSGECYKAIPGTTFYLGTDLEE